MPTQDQPTKRENDLASIDTAADDPRLSRDEREFLESLRLQVNADTPLTKKQRAAINAIRTASSARPMPDRPSASSLLANLPRPLRPPTAHRLPV